MTRKTDHTEEVRNYEPRVMAYSVAIWLAASAAVCGTVGTICVQWRQADLTETRQNYSDALLVYEAYRKPGTFGTTKEGLKKFREEQNACLGVVPGSHGSARCHGLLGLPLPPEDEAPQDLIAMAGEYILQAGRGIKAGFRFLRKPAF